MALSHLIYSAGPLFSPLRIIPGPPNPSLLYGNSTEIWREDAGEMWERWTEQYGTTFKFKDFLSRDLLYTVDLRAAFNIITEGDAHRRQRRIMNPAFGPAQVRELTGIFVDKSVHLRDVLKTQLGPDGAPARIDVLAWLGRATLDIIGLAGFNYGFDALDGKEDGLNKALATIFQAGEEVHALQILQAYFPILHFIPSERDRIIRYAKDAMNLIGRRLIEERKVAIQAEKAGGHVEKGDVRGRDLLSLLIRANMAVDVPDNQRLSDEDMLAQIPTFLVAGHETTSTGTTWGLFALTQNLAAQRRLREELLACPTDTPTMDELQALPYLDAVVRETLRLHAPVLETSRHAEQDAVIPLADPFLDKNGVWREEIRIMKGDGIIIPIAGLNRLASIWGPDAHEFVPERWLKPVPDAAHNMPGVWGNLLSFLGGPRACIGYRFSLIEMKALLFTLVRAFEFELAVPVTEIRRKSEIVTRPFVASEMDKGNQMPLLVRAYRPQSDM